MIIEEINKKAEQRKENKIIIDILKNLKLPEKYKILESDYCEQLVICKGIFDNKIANIKRENEVILLTFEDEERLEELRKYIEDSEVQFKIKLGGGYY